MRRAPGRSGAVAAQARTVTGPRGGGPGGRRGNGAPTGLSPARGLAHRCRPRRRGAPTGRRARTPCPVVRGAGRGPAVPRRLVRLGDLRPCAVHGRRSGAALGEARRVLRPGGRLRVLEHVRSPRPALARAQTLANPAWGAVAGGCHLDRDTRQSILAVGFR